jgi:transposase
MISDLPCAGRRIELHLTVRRFVCSADHCRRKIFTERFRGDIVRPMARRTARLDTLIAISLLHWVVVRQHGS